MQDKRRDYIYIGLTALAVIAIAILFGFILAKFSVILTFFNNIITIIMPIIIGAIMTFLMAPVFDKTTAFLTPKLGYIVKSQVKARKYAKTISTFVSLILMILILSSMVLMLLPQLIQSISDMIKTLPDNITAISNMIQVVFENNPDLEATLTQYYYDTINGLYSWMSNTLLPNLNAYISSFSTGIKAVITWVFNILIGLIVMMYMLNMKQTLLAHSKKIIYSILPIKWANIVVEETRYVRGVFSNFVIGKIIDSVIIGVMNYIFMLIVGMQYSLLISVIVGVTNVIPFFGPFIGAIPSIIILLLYSPMQAVYFAVWILILQQIDGNIIGPKILGQTTGLSSFWILFSILLFGGLFGIFGMIIAVPLWAVIYRFVGNLSKFLLHRKNLREDSMEYLHLDYIDEESKEYVQLNDKL